MMSPDTKVFGIGMFKTGTTSLEDALDLLGMNHIPGVKYEDCFLGLDDPEYDFSSHVFTDLEKKAIRDLTSSYNAFTDHPWMWCYKYCDQLYPDSKFILTTRSSPEKVADSEIKFWKAMNQASNIDPDTVETPNRQLFIDRYVKHAEDVRSYFKDSPKFLEVCWENGDGWKELMEFLVGPFPHSNSSQWVQERIKELKLYTDGKGRNTPEKREIARQDLLRGI